MLCTVQETYESTKMMEFSTKHIPFEKCVVKAQIWDIPPGQQRNQDLLENYFSGAFGAMLVYDVNNPQSFECLKTIWMNNIRVYGTGKMGIVLGEQQLVYSIYF